MMGVSKSKQRENIQEAIIVKEIVAGPKKISNCDKLIQFMNNKEESNAITLYSVMTSEERMTRNALNETYLIYACKHELINLCFVILHSPEAQLDAVSCQSETALIWATNCYHFYAINHIKPYNLYHISPY